jgi:ankyrin repeat protein
MKTLPAALRLLFTTYRAAAPSAPKLPQKALTPLMRVLGVIALIALVAFTLNPPGNAKLYKAMDRGDEATALQLIKDGANPNSTFGTIGLDSENVPADQNPLHFALWHGQQKVAVALIQAGADPNSRDHLGRTALIVSANAGYTEVVRALLAKGADSRAASSSDGETPLRNGPKGPGGWYPSFGNFPKSLKPEIREMLIKAGAQ